MQKPLINVALRKPASQSSTSQWSTQNDAQGVLLNNQTLPFGFHTDADKTGAWWKVDLKVVYPIEKIVLHNRRDTCLDKASSIRIEVSQDGIYWLTIHSGSVFFDGHNNPLVLRLGGRLARYLRLSIDPDLHFHLSRVQVLCEEERVCEADQQAVMAGAVSLNNDRNKIRCAILGTSNSVMRKGYVSALSTSGLDVTTNVSIGSSHAGLMIHAIEQLDKEHDVLIIDLAVNEQNALDKWRYDLNLSSEILDYGLIWCAKNKILPLILIMPLLNHTCNYPATRRHYIDFCNRRSIPYLDGYELVEQLALCLKRSIQSLFWDEFHLNAFAAQVLGAALAQAIAAMFSRRECPTFQLAQTSGMFHGFAFVQAAKYRSQGETIRRTNALLSVDLIQLKANDKLSVSVPSEARLVGFVFNMARTNAIIQISGETLLMKQLDNDYFQNRDGFWLVSWLNIDHVIAKDGKFELTVLHPDNVSDFEDNDHRSFKNKSIDYATIELYGFLIKLPPQAQNIVTVTGIDINMTRVIDFSKVTFV